MSYAWEFYQKQATDTIKNSTAGEFFSTEAVGDVTDALVREGIQNTLDARRKRPNGSRDKAHVRIFLSEMSQALPASQAQRWFETLWPHVLAPGNGLRNQPALADPCPYLVFEDFGTRGLTGDPEADDQLGEDINHFLRFFRGEGLSGSGDDKIIGSWGVGKTVFPRASRISSFFGLTVREDNPRHLLLGRSILKYHRVHGQSYKSDGYFGLRRTDGFMLPCSDPEVLKEFRNDFRVKRQDDSGLSVVVPWYEINGDDAISRDKMLAAVLRGFFYPILMGDLAVTVATPGEEVTLDAGSIMPKIEAIGGSLAAELLPMLELTEWARTRLASEFLSLAAPPPDEAPKWLPESVPETMVCHIRQLLAQRQRIALRVPMHAQAKAGEPEATHFNMFLEHSNEDGKKPVFIRDELIIPRAGARPISQVRALVIVEDRPIAKLLRDAEKPAHDEWSTKTANFKDKYQFGWSTISFVRHSVSELLRIVNQAEQRPDPSITIDFFSVPAEPEDQDAVPSRRRKPKQTKGGGPGLPPAKIPPPPPPRFRINKLQGGFSIRPGAPEAPLPAYIEIRTAYDIRLGNPLKKYHRADFDLARSPIGCQSNGLEVRITDGNRMLVAVLQHDFQLDVSGFDPDRDLYVKAVAKEAADVD